MGAFALGAEEREQFRGLRAGVADLVRDAVSNFAASPGPNWFSWSPDTTVKPYRCTRPQRGASD
ncbi:hypothetical protein [Micromonospora humida]|uniref:Uncharacterized protein n=1 Tax=Micromonospora humida TaxID=2809018 RepID=A0ABS2IS28_9ACTN|nr:hypothetical protein [Micromonospora humida]MBM7077145.1 hypothetical protein [Micromonospora humida]